MIASTTTGVGVLHGDSLFSDANRRRFEHWTWVPAQPGTFPLLVLLHGVYDAGGFVWWHKGQVHRTLERLVAEGTIPPMVVLMAPDTGAEQGSGYCDWADDTTRAETYIVEELLGWATDNLPVDDTRWISGLSMGGYGALTLALRNPGLFCSATALSGFFDPTQLFAFVDEAATRMWGDDAGRDAHDPRLLIAEDARREGLRIAFDCGVDDHLIDQNRALHRRLTDAGVDHGYAEHPGGHTWEYWTEHLADHLRFHAGVPSPLARGGPRSRTVELDDGGLRLDGEDD